MPQEGGTHPREFKRDWGPKDPKGLRMVEEVRKEFKKSSFSN
jgi:hypothetical protein